MARADIRRTGVDIFAIDLVGEEVKVVLLHEVAYLVHLAAGVEIARGVVGIADHDGTCAVVDELLKLLHLWQREAFLYSSSYGTYARARGDGKRHVVGVGWLGDDNLVARVKTRHKGEEHRLASSRGDDDVVGIDIDVVTTVIAHELLTVALDTLGRRIFKNVAVDTLQGIESNLWCGQIGLADVEVIDLRPTLLCSGSKRCELAYRRLGHLVSANRYFRHDSTKKLFFDCKGTIINWKTAN